MPEQVRDEPAAVGSMTATPATLSELRAAMRDSGNRARLKTAVCHHVDAARAQGQRVEHVIIDLKQELRGAGVVDKYTTPDERALAESVIRWCIERYYGRAD